MIDDVRAALARDVANPGLRTRDELISELADQVVFALHSREDDDEVDRRAPILVHGTEAIFDEVCDLLAIRGYPGITAHASGLGVELRLPEPDATEQDVETIPEDVVLEQDPDHGE